MRIASRTFVLGAVVLGLAAAVGCGGSSSSSGAGGTSSTSSSTTTSSTTTSSSSTSTSTSSGMQACQDSVHASCTKRDTCSLNGYLNDKNWGSEMICEMRSLPGCLSSLQATGTAQTPAHIEACVAAYPSYTCTDFYDGNPPTACVPPAGNTAKGAACGASAQCASTYCSISVNQVCGTCQPQPLAGDSCQQGADCGRDLACAVPAGMTTGKCAAFVASGGMCLTGTAPCAAGLACVGDNPTTPTMGTCMAQGSTVGAACDNSRKTMANCDGNLGLTCIPTAAGNPVGKCAAITLAMPGQPCGNMGMPPTAVADCAAGGLCVNKVCVAPAADGAACDTALGPPCLNPAKCVPTGAGTAGTCVVPNATMCH